MYFLRNTQLNYVSVVYFFTLSFTQRKHDFLVLFGDKKKIHNKIMISVPVTNRSNTYFSAEGSLAMSNGSSIDN